MARKAGVELFGNASSLSRAFRQAGESVGIFRRELKEVSVSAQKTAQVQVAAAVKTDERLRQEMRAYRELAAASKRGSREQIAAANLASRTQGRLARSTAVSARESIRHARVSSGSHHELGRSTRGALAASGAFSRLGRSIAFASSYFLGGYGVVYGLKSAVGASSDLAEQVSKTNVVFGRSARGINKWAEGTAAAFGISHRAALTYAGTFGALFRPLGVGQRQSAGLSRALVERAADLASFYNTSEEDALQALQSGLVGQVRPLRRYGVQLSADRLKAVAFATGIAKPDVDARKVGEAEDRVAIAQAKLAEARRKHGAGSTEAATAALALKKAEDGLHSALAGSTSELTAQQKTLARYQIIMRDSALAKGDFARTSGHLAQQEKILRAQLENQETMIGNKLTPIVLHYVRSLNQWLGKSGNQARVTRTITQAIHVLAAGIRTAVGIIRTAARVASAFAHAVGGWKAAFWIVTSGYLAFRLAKLVTRFVEFVAELRALRAAAIAADAEVGAAGLLGSLTALGAIGAIAVTVLVYVKYRKQISSGISKASRGLLHGLGIDTSPSKETTPEGGGLHWEGSRLVWWDGTPYGETGGKPPPRPKLDTGSPDDRPGIRTSAAQSVQNAAQGARARERELERERDRLERERERRARLRAAAAARAARMRQVAAQYRLLGLGPDGQELAPSRRSLRRELGTVSAAIKGTFLDTDEHRSLLRRLRRLISGQLGSLSSDMRSKIKELLDGLKGQLDEFDGFNLTRAERRRRFLDRQLSRADRYRAHPAGHVTKVYNQPITVHADPKEPWERAAKRAHWRLRHAS